MNIPNILRTLLATSLVMSTPLTFAHTGHAESGLLSGFIHPFMGLDHIIVMFAIGLWAARIGGKAVVIVPVAFVTTMILACVLTVIGMNVPFIEQGIISSVIFFRIITSGFLSIFCPNRQCISRYICVLSRCRPWNRNAG